MAHNEHVSDAHHVEDDVKTDSASDTPARNECPSDIGSDVKAQKRKTDTFDEESRQCLPSDPRRGRRANALKESSRTAGVIPRLVPHFEGLHQEGKTSKAYLCSPNTDHVATGLWDLGWGCGYRNCQMLMTFLQRQEEAGDRVLKQVSDITGLQILLEKAWHDDFDREGADQLKHRVYKTRKWIGTTEVHVMLAYLGIRSTILDFHQPTAENTHDAMLDWIQSYFEKAPLVHTKEHDIVHITDRPPLYLQHSGHSRTVIGIELLQNGKRNLIMFDPGRRMLRTYRTKLSDNQPPTNPEDDMEQSELPPSLAGDHHSPSYASLIASTLQNMASRFLSYFTYAQLPANMLRPFRVNAETVEKNRQYQLLVLGQVMNDSTQAEYLCWNEKKGYLLDAPEREAMKHVTSLVGTPPN